MDRRVSNHQTAVWLLLVQTPGIALRGRVMLLAAAGVLAVWLADACVADASSSAAPPIDSWAELPRAAWASMLAAWSDFYEPFMSLVAGEAIGAALFRCFVRIAVWGLAGGAIARIAAMQLTRDESPDPLGAVQFTFRNRSGFWGGPALLLAGLLLVALPLAVVRLGMHIAWLAPVAAVFWPVVVVLGLLATLYAFATAVGWPLVGAAAAVDNSDAFDAVSRMFAYVYQKPLRLAGYVSFTLALGVLAAITAQTLATGVQHACTFAAGEAISPWSASTIAWWNSVAASLVTVYLTAYLWTAATGVYLLRRQDIDGVHTDEVYIDPNEYAGDLPTLAEDSLGVPAIEKEAEAA